ncbi:hypothetical protein FACS1894201_01290 [Bacteroidia bacterium]|nr:hypothetical protein FACS1894201_01290 [Bacteroidia bacterium]
MVRKNTLFAFLLLSVLFQSCLSDDFTPLVIDDAEKEYTDYQTTVSELSGLCFTKNKASFMAVSDRGIIYEISKTDFKARKLPFLGTNDLEGITTNTATDEVYVIDEAENTVYKLSADEKSLTRVVKINIPNPVHNKGLEGISYGNDTLYIVNQAEPTRLVKYCLTTKTTAYIDVAFADYLSDICFDDSDNTLWIVDSKSKKVFHCDLKATVLGTQPIAYIAQAEGIAVDRAAGYMWIGCDISSKLYKIKIKL